MKREGLTKAQERKARIAELEKIVTELRKYIKDNGTAFARFSNKIDSIMTQSSIPNKGQLVAKAINELELEIHKSLHFGAELSFEEINRLYRTQKK